MFGRHLYRGGLGRGRDELAGMIAREVKDPRVAAAGVVGVTRVECTPDLSVARVYVSIYASDALAQKALAGLAASAGFLRGPVGRRLNLQRPPELRFVRDESAELNLKLTSIVREDEAKARAAGRGPAEPVVEAKPEAEPDAGPDAEPDAEPAVDAEPASEA